MSNDVVTSNTQSTEGAEVIVTKEQVREIPASNVRSSLERLESAASQVVHRLESVKTVLEEEARENEVTAAPSNLVLPDKKLPSEILTALETLISQPFDVENADELAEYPLPPIDEISHLVLVSHSIISYLRYLNRRQLLKLTSHILNDTNRWLSNMFRFADCSASYHSDSSECLVRAIRLALVAKFPNYFERGVRSLPEVGIYVSENSSHIGLQFACRQIGLPISSVRLVPCITTDTGLSCIDVSALQKAIALDANSARVPIFILADVGASLLGEADNVARLQEVCRLNHIWFHCRGNALAALILMQSSGGETGPVADSLTLNMSSWFGVPGVQTVLLHRTLSNVAPAILFDSDPLHSRYLSAICVWMMLQSIGKDAITERILTAFTSVRDFYEIITKVEGLVILSKPPGAVPIGDLIEKPLNLSLLFETAVPVVIFKFMGNSDASEVNPEANHPAYYDRLNSWLGQILQRDSSQIDLELIELPSHGTCIRFCPLQLGVGELPPTEEYLANFASCIDAQVEILRATVKHRQTFNQLVNEHPSLQLIDLEDWAGLGGVRYIPEFFDTDADDAQFNLNKLNCTLVDHLRATDSAFSLGEGVDGLTCVRFGMVTEDTDVNELLELVIDAGKAIQEDSRVLDTMSEIVKKGIEAATIELQKENEEKLWQEGILRHVPVVGTFVNWFSPPAREAGVKGRSLNLTQGVIESTENIYKYHMQLQSGQTIGGNQTPGSGHSRSESQSSTISTNKQPQVVNAAAAVVEPLAVKEEVKEEEEEPRQQEVKVEEEKAQTEVSTS